MAVIHYPLTEKQQKVLDIINASIASRGCSPTIREITLQAGIQSPNGAICHIKALVRKGILDQPKAGVARSLNVKGKRSKQAKLIRPEDATKRQFQVLKAIARLTKQNKVSPSHRELMDELDIKSPNGVRCHLVALKKKGLIEWLPELGRTIRLTDKCFAQS